MKPCILLKETLTSLPKENAHYGLGGREITCDSVAGAWGKRTDSYAGRYAGHVFVDHPGMCFGSLELLQTDLKGLL